MNGFAVGDRMLRPLMIALANCRPRSCHNLLIAKGAAHCDLPLLEDDREGRRAGDGNGSIVEDDSEGCRAGEANGALLEVDTDSREEGTRTWL